MFRRPSRGLDSQRSEVSQVIDTQKISDLPILGRDFIDFALLTPGVAVGRSTSVGAQSPFQETVLQLSFGGLARNSQRILWPRRHRLHHQHFGRTA